MKVKVINFLSYSGQEKPNLFPKYQTSPLLLAYVHISIINILRGALGVFQRVLCLPGLRKHRLGWWGHRSTWDGVFYPHCAFVIGWNGWVCVNKGIVTIWRIKHSVGKRRTGFNLKILWHLCITMQQQTVHFKERMVENFEAKWVYGL